jgi:hypothetical protein
MFPVRHELGLYIEEDDIFPVFYYYYYYYYFMPPPPEVMLGLVLIQTYIKNCNKNVSMNTSIK